MTDCSKHRVRPTEDGAALELYEEKSGHVLLVTQDVSVQTLVEVVARAKERRS